MRLQRQEGFSRCKRSGALRRAKEGLPEKKGKEEVLLLLFFWKETLRMGFGLRLHEISNGTITTKRVSAWRNLGIGMISGQSVYHLRANAAGTARQWGGIEEDNRRWINGLLWILRTGTHGVICHQTTGNGAPFIGGFEMAG